MTNSPKGKPIVSISCLAYNHGLYIRECLEGFIMQETTFPFEVLIHDDASKDETSAIIREFELKYPNIIKPIYQSENQFTKGKQLSKTYNFPRALGKYIALCEGDDSWTDPHKLQKQVDFLEQHPSYSLCVGGYVKREVESGKEKIIIKDLNENGTDEAGFTFTLNDTKKGWLTKTLTAVFRNDKKLFEELDKYEHGRDINLFYHILKCGKGFYFKSVMGIYNVHQGGINSMKAGKVNNNAAYVVFKELYKFNKDEFCRYKYIRSTLNLLNYNCYYGNSKRGFSPNAKLFLEALVVVRSLREFTILFTSLLPDKVKAVYRGKITPNLKTY